MEIELAEVRDFLARHAPFDTLPDDLLQDLPRRLTVRYLRRGSVFPPEGAAPGQLYIVRSGAIELRDEQDRLREKLGEGDLFANPCQFVDLEPARGRAGEDSLVYQLPCAQAEALRKASPRFDAHFVGSLRERLRHAVDSGDWGGPGGASPLTLEVRDLARREPVIVDAGETIQGVAQEMNRRRSSSAILTEAGRPVGIITDRDLRRRCVAEGLDYATPAREIMAGDIEVIHASALIMEALVVMARSDVHHLPVTDGERLMGMITASDIVRLGSISPAFLAGDARRAASLEDLVHVARRVPELQMQLANSSATARHTGEAVTCITDTITIRLLEMAEGRLGLPPIPYAWLAVGSQARRELGAHSDQDHALLLADDPDPEQARYFEELSSLVSDGLNACGYVYCPGDAMATNPRWRQPLLTWRRYFSDWIESPEPKAVMLSSIFFDMRVVYGEAGLFSELQEDFLAKARANRIFIAYSVANALTHRPPLGFFRTFVLVHDGEHDATLDVKHRGVVPITDVARIYALSEGLTEVNTSERLRAAVTSGALSRDMGESLDDALELVGSLRLRHQAGQIRAGEAPDSYLPPAELSPLERRYLKDAFRVIQDIQETLENRYQAARFA